MSNLGYAALLTLPSVSLSLQRSNFDSLFLVLFLAFFKFSTLAWLSQILWTLEVYRWKSWDLSIVDKLFLFEDYGFLQDRFSPGFFGSVVVGDQSYFGDFHFCDPRLLVFHVQKWRLWYWSITHWQFWYYWRCFWRQRQGYFQTSSITSWISSVD